MEGYVGSKADLDNMNKKKTLAPARIQTVISWAYSL